MPRPDPIHRAVRRALAVHLIPLRVLALGAEVRALPDRVAATIADQVAARIAAEAKRARRSA